MSFYLKKSKIFFAFTRHLEVAGVSSNTLKNYRSDLKLFGEWIALTLKETGVSTESLDEALPFLTTDLASEFKAYLQHNSPDKSVNRRLSTLRALSRFLVAAAINEMDFMEGIANLGPENRSTFHPLLGHFQKHLEEEKVSANTIKNYVSDVKHFLSWLKTNHQALGSKL